ncbi:MAG: pyridoxamine 5'-phosphate oxidase family protein [Bacteroidaceae bacterium]|nr:pyridoxamine 5'-phosphate oxidase family protein [Bacteroidaceae bacterium]
MKTLTIEDNQQIATIIQGCDTCFVGLTDLEDNPYVLPMSFGYADGVIYLHSGPEGSKLEMLEHNPKVCITFCSPGQLTYQHPEMACSYSMHSESVICRGIVHFIEEINEKRRIMNIIMHHYTDNKYGYSEPAIAYVKIWQVDITQMSAKAFGRKRDELK